MNYLWFEIKKSWLRFPILVAAVLFCIIDAVKIYCTNSVPDNNADNKNKSYQAAYFEIYNNILSGEITNEKTKYVKENLFRLRSKIQSGNFSKDYDENTLTGHIYNDWSLFEFDFYPALEYILLYPNTSNEITSRAYENTVFYIEHSNKKLAQKNYYIYTLYQNRKILNFNLTEWVSHYFEYNFSSLLIIILIIIGLAPSFSYEKESGMNILIKSSGNIKKSAAAKIISACVYILLLTLLFSFLDYTVFKCCYGADGLNNPLYSAKFFELSPFSFSLLSAIFVCMSAKFLAFLAIGYIILLLSNFTGNTILSLCASFLSAVVLISTLKINSSVLNSINMLSAYKMVREYDCVFLFDRPILSLYAAFILYLFMATSKNPHLKHQNEKSMVNLTNFSVKKASNKAKTLLF